MMTSDTETISHLQWRIQRLEDFIGKSNKTKIVETINKLNEQVFEHANNSLTARKLVKRVDEINRLTNSNFQHYLMENRSTKLELILADEQRIRNVTKNLTKIDTLAQVLNGECFQEVPKLFSALNKLLIIHDNIKNQYGEYTQEISAFLQDYAAFTLLMDKNLQQYKSVLNKNEQKLTIIKDDPVE
ncbi:unnamed protein product [Adineta steineri]|uniref:Uncharacterized protein n=2 Tax=Adineta steineri TaxID=433720 RepID=A0A815LR09_9BILA|nr:unnamed protein product [Adineta steineri]